MAKRTTVAVPISGEDLAVVDAIREQQFVKVGRAEVVRSLMRLGIVYRQAQEQTPTPTA